MQAETTNQRLKAKRIFEQVVTKKKKKIIKTLTSHPRSSEKSKWDNFRAQHSDTL